MPSTFSRRALLRAGPAMPDFPAAPRFDDTACGAARIGGERGTPVVAGHAQGFDDRAEVRA